MKRLIDKLIERFRGNRPKTIKLRPRNERFGSGLAPVVVDLRDRRR